jgi:hypothetical protein
MLHKETVEASTLDMIKCLMADAELQDFFMVGGTALSLLIGHRISIDVDLFTEKDFDAVSLRQYLEQNHTMTDAKTIGNGVFGFIDNVKIDIIAHKYPLIKPLEIMEGIRMSSLEDIGAMKLNAIAGSGNRLKDFVDMYYLLEHKPFKFLGNAYEQKYPNVNIQMAGNSLLYFNDIDHSVSIKLMNGVVEWGKIDKRLHQAVYNPMKTFPSSTAGASPPRAGDLNYL